MPIAKLTLNVPDEMATALEVLGRKNEQTPEEYAAEFLERHLGQWSRQLAHFHELIRQGEESGNPIPVDDVYFERKREQLRERFKHIQRGDAASEVEAK